MPARLTLPARLRLRHKGDFAAAHARGRRMSDGFFAVTVMRNDVGAPRLGLAVAVEGAGNAVGAERVAGILPECFRPPHRELTPLATLVSARSPGSAAA